MVSQFKFKFTVFKIALFKLINNYPKVKYSSLSLPCFKGYLKTIRKIYKENSSEFKLLFFKIS